MRHYRKLGIAAIAALLGGGILYQILIEPSAFAQATSSAASNPPATAVSTSTTARRVSRPHRGGVGIPDVRGGLGTATTGDPVPLSVADCTAVGGTVVIQPNVCPNSDSALNGRRCVVNGNLSTDPGKIACITESS